MTKGTIAKGVLIFLVVPGELLLLLFISQHASHQHTLSPTRSLAAPELSSSPPSQTQLERSADKVSVRTIAASSSYDTNSQISAGARDTRDIVNNCANQTNKESRSLVVSDRAHPHANISTRNEGRSVGGGVLPVNGIKVGAKFTE